ncbi:unnamed protein product [Rotaria sordida]|uniref:CCHC-type domain-containing protein n=1 Tax=Rotaria sordida TaxID=392033 RepID=A0A814LQX5_9BILA|nr:unnamed protein product [Rotaria sordida]
MENSTKFIPTLTPTFEQWKSLPIYLTHHETSLQRRFGAVKILPPSRWVPLIKNPYELRHIKMYIKQEIIRSSHQPDVFYIQNSETPKRRFMTYEEFKTIAESDTYRLEDTVNSNIMDYFWSTISNSVSLYVPNIDDSLFTKRETSFNMANLASLLKYYPKRIPGVTTSVLHMGMWSSAVGTHIDEYDLISLNYLHHGSPKIWYIIHPSCYTKFEELVNKLKLFSDISSSCCLSPLQHKTLLIKPSFLHIHSIEYYQIEQKLNELIVIFPGTYHFYFDTGFNLSETVKYALPSFLQFQRRSPRLCSCTISSSSIFVNINRRFFTNDILNQFQKEYLTSTSSTCIDLSIDDDNNNNNNTNNSSTNEIIISPTSPIENHNNIIQTNVENEVVRITSQTNMSIDQYTDPFYSSSSSTNCNTPISTNLISTIDNHNDYENISNIFEEILSQTNSNPIRYNNYSRYYHPYEPYSGFIQNYTSPMHPSFFKPYSYSPLRICNSKRNRKRRKCYGCRQSGHLRKECPYFPQE